MKSARFSHRAHRDRPRAALNASRAMASESSEALGGSDDERLDPHYKRDLDAVEQ